MFGSPVLEVILAVAAAYAGLGVICSGLCEWLAAALRWRPALLEAGLRALLADACGSDGRSMVEHFLQAPLIQPLGHAPATMNGPSAARAGPPYIPPRAFTLTVLELIQPVDWQGEPLTFNDFSRMVERLPDSRFKKALQAIGRSSNHDVELVRRNLDAWFDQVMECVSSLYQRRLWATSLAVSAFLCCGLGVDTLAMIGTVWGESLRREDAPATVVINSPSELIAPRLTEPARAVNEPATSFSGPRLPVPFAPLTTPTPRSAPSRELSWIELGPLVPHILGLLLSTMGVAISAPLGFDLLNRFTNVRLSSPPPRSKKMAKPDESSGKAPAALASPKQDAVSLNQLHPERKRPHKADVDL